MKRLSPYKITALVSLAIFGCLYCSIVRDLSGDLKTIGVLALIAGSLYMIFVGLRDDTAKQSIRLAFGVASLVVTLALVGATIFLLF